MFPWILGLVLTVLGLFFVVSWLRNAKPETVSALLILGGGFIGVSILGFLLLTGKVSPWGMLSSAPFFLPLILKLLGRTRGSKKADARGSGDTGNGRSTRDAKSSQATGGIGNLEARRILGLPEKSQLSEEDINRAWQHLMKAAHPDRGGSEHLARMLNEARNVLIQSLRR